MSQHKKVVAIHDLSGYGRCALSVIIPVISATGIQVVPVPTAVLSTHTGGFDNIVIRNLTEHITDCYNHYKQLGVDFDCIYSGFLSSPEQVDGCLLYLEGYKDALKVVDPVLGDNGKPYKTCTKELMKRMRELTSKADIITPNLTEAAILLDEDYPKALTEQQAKDWIMRLAEKPQMAVLKGVPLLEDKDGDKVSLINIGYDKKTDEFWRVDWNHVPANYPGTGDIFCSVLTSALMKGETLPEAICRASQFTELTINTTFKNGTEQRTGVLFEYDLGWLMEDKKMTQFKKM
ncbi:MAG: pyridoxamine kinase [Ruminiclostridium sp.]|nr:pyridoxamine kinase [Ruminiclostridium sp.]